MNIRKLLTQALIAVVSTAVGFFVTRVGLAGLTSPEDYYRSGRRSALDKLGRKDEL